MRHFLSIAGINEDEFIFILNKSISIKENAKRAIIEKMLKKESFLSKIKENWISILKE